MLPKLADGGSVTLTVSGCSMHPMLRHRQDSVQLRSAEHFRKGDLIFYRREDGSFVLHRIVRVVAPGEFICCGDNQYEPESVAQNQVFAKMTAFTRKGKAYSEDSPGYRIYVAAWVAAFPVRRPILALRRRVGNLRRKLSK